MSANKPHYCPAYLAYTLVGKMRLRIPKVSIYGYFGPVDLLRTCQRNATDRPGPIHTDETCTSLMPGLPGIVS